MGRTSLNRLTLAFVVAALTVSAGIPSAAASGTIGQRAAKAALAEAGTPYARGGATPGGFDASGLVIWAYAQVGVTLPHSPRALWLAGRHVARSTLRIGDIVFFSDHAHVGIYLGHNEFVHAPHTGAVVRVQNLVTGFYARHYIGAVRLRL